MPGFQLGPDCSCCGVCEATDTNEDFESGIGGNWTQYAGTWNAVSGEAHTSSTNAILDTVVLIVTGKQLL